MYQNYNYYPQNQQPTGQQMPNYNTIPNYLRQGQPQVGLKGRMVSSIEEARATSIDFDGSIFYFPDLANKRIYTKQINMDGTATLNMYELREMPVVNDAQSFPAMNNYVTRDEFEQVINQLRAMYVPPEQPAVKPEPAPKKTEVLNF